MINEILSPKNVLGTDTIKTLTWTEKPTAADFGKGQAWFSDIGVDGTLFFSNGTKFIPCKPIILALSQKGWLVPALASANAATYSQSETTITVSSTAHNIPATIQDGKDIYLVIGSGAAVSGWFTNFTYIDANTFSCTSSVSQTTSGVVNTNISQVTVSELTKTIKANLLGLNGKIRVNVTASMNNSAGAKSVRVYFGGNGFITIQGTTHLSVSALGRTLANKNSLSKQVSQTIAAYGGGSSAAAVVNMSVNTAADADITLTLQAAVANDYVALESVLYELIL
ncbi:MAG: hypothetical protein PHG08_01070 [Bacilli bacterium]|nr:hypothetical protein [Bacilli bacterium]